MQRLLMLILASALLALPAWAQETDEPAAAADESAPAAAEEAPAADPATEEPPVVDDVYYQDADDKDFRPSEDIPADQSISFPSDI